MASHYINLFKKHGDSHSSVQYSSKESQYKRFEELIKIGNIENSTILDYGCGLGDLYSYLREKKFDGCKYTGVDLVPDFVKACTDKYHMCRFYTPNDWPTQTLYEYAFVSGVFNNIRDDAKSFWMETIKYLFSRTTKGLAFNMMSKYVDYEADDLFYVWPEDVFNYCKTLTPYITINNAYSIDKDKPPFEFAVYIYHSGN